MAERFKLIAKSGFFFVKHKLSNQVHVFKTNVDPSQVHIYPVELAVDHFSIDENCDYTYFASQCYEYLRNGEYLRLQLSPVHVLGMSFFMDVCADSEISALTREYQNLSLERLIALSEEVLKDEGLSPHLKSSIEISMGLYQSNGTLTTRQQNFLAFCLSQSQQQSLAKSV